MTRLRRLIWACVLAAGISTASASAAWASTFYVNGATGKDTNSCTEPTAACKTIGAAVTKSEVVLGAATIEVAAGVYPGILDLSSAADNGITINGVGNSVSGTVIEGLATAKEPTIATGPGNTATLSNLRVVDPAGQEGAGVASAAGLTLDNVVVDMQNAGDYDGIEGAEIGSLSMNGGGVTMESGNQGVAIASGIVQTTLTGVTVTLANGATGSGIETEFAPASLSNVDVSLGSGATGAGIETEFAPASLSNVDVSLGSGATGAGIETAFAPLSLSNVNVSLGSSATGTGIAAQLSNPLTANGVTVTMADAASTSPALVQDFTSATFDHLTVEGAWKGPALEATYGTDTLADSRLTTNGSDPAILDAESGEGRGLYLERSVVQAPAGVPETLLVFNGNATLDSSEVLGGSNAINFEQSVSKARTLTIDASTIDAGVLGERDGGSVRGVAVVSVGTKSLASVNIEGSILLEPQAATAGPEATATITCTYSDVPNQSQAAKGAEGTIDCANGVNGNTTTTLLSSLFAAPITNYVLNPSSSAVDSVPVSAITLPFGLTPSTTDLAGNPRSEDLDCVALQDKGALELQGRSTPCPAPTPPPSPTPSVAKPLAGIISALTISPSAFFAAPSGPTISAIAAKAKKYGATITYRDSQIATTTFTVLRETSGRKQGKSCKKPSKSNKHGKRCTIITAIGSFTHLDIAGANSLHFSGRLKGKKLPAGSYKLQAVAHDAAGNGAAVEKSFKIK